MDKVMSILCSTCIPACITRNSLNIYRGEKCFEQKLRHFMYNTFVLMCHSVWEN